MGVLELVVANIERVSLQFVDKRVSLVFFDRNLAESPTENIEDSYQELMKYGFEKNYWNEYIFLAYRNHRDDMIILEGLPDTQSSMPHAK